MAPITSTHRWSRLRIPVAAAVGLAVGLGGGLGLSACSSDFEKASHISKLRALGVRAEPPELILAADGGLPATTLTALAVEPNGNPISVRFAICKDQGTLPSADLDCPGDAGVDLPDAGPLSARLDLNDPAVQTLALALQAGADGGAGSGADAGTDGGTLSQLLDAGLPIILGFELTAPAGLAPDGGPPPTPGSTQQRIRGLASVTLRSASADRPPNHNPELEDLLKDGLPLKADGGSILQAGKLVTLLPKTATGAKEPTAGGPERLDFAFFSTEGEVGSLRSVDTTATGQPGLASVDYTAPAAGVPVRFWVVVRDGRGGVGWLERSASTGP